MVLNVHIRLIRDGEKGVWRWGEEGEYIYSYRYTVTTIIVQELCESRGGRPELSVLTSLLVSVDVKLY